jgi:hypothetical protein
MFLSTAWISRRTADRRLDGGERVRTTKVISAQQLMTEAPFSVHNAAYILVGFICLFFAKYGEEEEEDEQPIDQTNLLVVVGYQFAALLFSLIFVDNLLRWIEGRGDSNWLWLCSGKSEMLVLFGVLGLVAHVFYWSGIVAVVNERRSGG